MSIYNVRLTGDSTSVEVEVHYRMKPWGVDIDEVYIAGTSTKLPLTAAEYFWLTKRIGADLAKDRT